MCWLHYVLINTFFTNICYAYFPGITSYTQSPVDFRRKNIRKHFNHPNLYLRHVICLGNDAEAVEAVCCSGSIPKPWLIILPTRRKVRCNHPDCSYICTSAIIANRYRRKSTASPLSSNDIMNKFGDIFINPGMMDSKNANITDNEKPLKRLNIDLTAKSEAQQMLKVPNIVLELLWLCGNAKKSEYNDSQGLLSICKSTDIKIGDLLNQLDLVTGNVKKTLSVESNDTDQQSFTDICNEEEFYNCTNVKDYSCKEKTTRSTICNTIKERATQGMKLITERTICSSKQDTSSSRIMTFSFLRTCPTKAGYKEGSFSNTTPSRLKISTFNPNIIPIKETNEQENNFDSILMNSSSTCCCQCPKKGKNEITDVNKSNFDTKKLKQILQAVFSMPKPCQHPDLKSSNSNREVPKFIETYKPGGSVELYVLYINKLYMHVYSEYKQAEWNYETNITNFTKQKAMSATIQLTQFQENMKKSLNSLYNIPIKDKYLKRQIKRLYMSGMSIPSDLQRNEFEQVMYGMQTIYSSASVSKWKDENEEINLPVISQAMSTSSNTEELKYYWSEWRNVTGRRIRSLFEHYVSLMDKTAKENGFHDASEMWMRYYESEEFFDSLNGHWEEIKPLYTELHAYVRHRLHEFYGNAVGAKDSGKIPAHLTGDIWSKDWTGICDKVSPFKEPSSFIDAMMSLNKKKLVPKAIAKKAENTFHLLGMSKFPNSFWKNSIFEKQRDVVMSCEPSAWDMHNGTDFRIKMCAHSSLEDLFEIYHQMAICEYLKEFNNLPFIFRDEASPGFYEGVAGAIVLSSKTQSHMEKLKLPYRTQSKESEIQDLMKLALQKVAFLPYSYILDLWRLKVFRGEIDNRNYNTKWWELRSRYQGISPPLERTENDFDAGAKLHVVTNKPYIKYFVSTIMQFQFYEALCKKAGFTGTIHKCDFTGSVKAGKTIRRVMGMGASKHWRAAMEEMTGVRRLDSGPLLRYFQPLYQWLKEKNIAEKVPVGWGE